MARRLLCARRTMKTQLRNKLAFTRETLRSLTAPQLDAARGGLTATWTCWCSPPPPEPVRSPELGSQLQIELNTRGAIIP
jgi:hypothetical protein